MRAVNLIPLEERRGLRGGGAGAGIGSYIVLGVLALVVAMSAAFTLANRTLTDRRAELTSVQAQVAQAESQAQQLASYTTFSALRQKRTETVRSLAASRFDWSHALHEIARTIPSNAWLTSLRGTVAPGINVEGGSDDPLRGAIPSPAIEIVGCTVSQADVASVISDLRRVDGVQRVSLSSSQRLDSSAATPTAASGSSGGGGSDDDCRHGNARFPQFSMTLFFKSPPAPGTQATTQGTTP
jgi:Tfp pilus assembly protein PilN